MPAIHFGTGTSTILPDLAAAGGDVIGVDWRLPIDVAWEQLGATYAVQGNLDPTLLLGPRHRMLRAAEDVLQRAAGRPGHIFNLGHGILPAVAARARPGARAVRARVPRQLTRVSWPPTPRPSPSTSPWSAADSPA